MVTKSRKEAGDDARATSAQFAASVKESAQQIWLAGLGAFSKAQEEGGRVFETLVREGVGIQKRTQAVAEEKLSEAAGKVSTMAADLSTKAAGQWDKLEGIFEDRVSRALQRLGVPAAQDVEALLRRIEELERTLAALQGGGARKASAKRAAAGKTAAAKTPARKRAPARKTAG